jgi:hypothetical protein
MTPMGCIGELVAADLQDAVVVGRASVIHDVDEFGVSTVDSPRVAMEALQDLGTLEHVA